MSVRVVNYGPSPYAPVGRQDLQWAASVTGTVNQLTYLEFSPAVSLEFAHNNSNISLYHTQTLGLNLSVRPRF